METRDIRGYEGLYQINELGDIFSRSRRGSKGTMLRRNNSKRPRSYPTVGLCKDGVKKTSNIHKLVAEAFIGECPTGKEINHRNGEKGDPRLLNLHYVTRSENALHARRELGVKGGTLPGEKHPLHKLVVQNVIDIRNEPIIRMYGHCAKLARKYGVDSTLISRIIKHRSWKHV